MIVDGPRNLRVRPKGHDHDNRERSEMPEMMTEELVGGLVRPMPVLQRKHEATPVGGAPQQSEQRLPENLAAGRPARHRRQRVFGVGRGQQMTERRRVPLRVELELLAGLDDLGDAFCRACAWSELQELGYHVDPWTVGGVDVDRRAAPGQHGDLLVPDAAQELVHEPALAEAGLRGDRNDLAMSGVGALEALSEMR